MYSSARFGRMTARPDWLTVRPILGGEPRMDLLSDVLRSVRVTGAVFLAAEFTAPWCVRASVTSEDCLQFMGKPAHVIAYHFVAEGSMLVSVGDGPASEVQAGEIVLFPQNDVHLMASEPNLEAVTASGLMQPQAEGKLMRIDHGGGGERARLICGFLASEQPYHPLLATLPKVVKVDVSRRSSRDWIESSLRFAASELAEGRLASSGTMSRVAEAVLTEAIQQYSSSLDDDGSGWLRGLQDPYIGRALTLIHQNLAAPWSNETLASEVALSRSAFVDRFTSIVGLPPIRYLTLWRLQTAKLNLRETRRTVAQLANSVGYESEEAFSRAFKREFGVSPSQWRTQQAS
jgi:AraC-like DNA-binding protein